MTAVTIIPYEPSNGSSSIGRGQGWGGSYRVMRAVLAVATPPPPGLLEMVYAERKRLRYIAAAIAQAQYEQLPEDHSIYGMIPGIQGVWANEPTEAACCAELAAALDDWITVRQHLQRAIPVIAGIDLNIDA